MSNSVIVLAPVAQRVAANRYIAAMAGENVLLSENLSRGCNATGLPDYGDPSGLEGATHIFGAFSNRSPEWLAIYQNLATTVPAPPGGFPVVVGGNVVLTEAEAVAAAQALVVSVLTQPGEWTTDLTNANLAAVLAGRNLKLIVAPEE